LAVQLDSLTAAVTTQHERRRSDEQDENYWELALSDPRVKADIRRMRPQ